MNAVKSSDARFRSSLLAGWFLLLCSGCATQGDTQEQGLSEKSPQVFELTTQADLAYRESRWIDAARSYQRLTQEIPQDAYPWFRLGNVYAQQGAYDRAIHAYETSLSNDAEQAKPWFNLSTAYLLNARLAMMRARDQLRPGDPARELIERRLEQLGALVHGRIEDSPTSVGLK